MVTANPASARSQTSSFKTSDYLWIHSLTSLHSVQIRPYEHSARKTLEFMFIISGHQGDCYPGQNAPASLKPPPHCADGGRALLLSGAKRPGLIEASPTHRMPTSSAGYPGQNAPASLKRLHIDVSLPYLLCYPGQNAPASLKLQFASPSGGLNNRYPGQNAPASLKPGEYSYIVPECACYPGQNAPASLKLELARRPRRIPPGYPGQNAPASLKLF